MNRKYQEEYRKLGLNISYYRKEKGLSQMKLAEKIDMSKTPHTQYLCGVMRYGQPLCHSKFTVIIRLNIPFMLIYGVNNN